MLGITWEKRELLNMNIWSKKKKRTRFLWKYISENGKEPPINKDQKYRMKNKRFLPFMENLCINSDKIKMILQKDPSTVSTTKSVVTLMENVMGDSEM